MEVEHQDDGQFSDGELEETPEEDEEDKEDDECLKPPIPLVKPLYKPGFQDSGFYQTSRVCLEKIIESMLHHRWQEAAEYIGCYAQTLVGRTKMRKREIPELIWRISSEVLRHLPNSKLEDYMLIYDRLKNAGVKNYLMITLEQVFHLLLQEQIEEARQRLQISESWQYGKVSAGQWQKTLLIQAYRGLLDYIIWCEKKGSLATDVPSKDDDDGDTEDKIGSSFFRNASVTLVEILKHPGVWDPFILSYVEMLQFYGDHEGAAKILHNYATDTSFPPNPNAQVYLYQFLLKRGDGTEQKQIMDVLKTLHGLVPSHELMLKYSRLLQESEEADGLSQALGVVLDMLDFACWSRNQETWTRLRAVIDELRRRRPDWEAVVADKMAARADWWPLIHFTRLHATRDAVEAPELKEVKVALLPVLFPGQKFKYSGGSGSS